MNTTIEQLHYSTGTFSGEIKSPYLQYTAPFNGGVTWDSSEEEISISEINFSDDIPVSEYQFMLDIIVIEMAAKYTYEIFEYWQQDAYDFHQMHLEDEKTGN